MFNRAVKHFDKRSSETIDEAFEDTSQRHHTRRSDAEKSFLGEFKCLFCLKEDDESKLMAAGTYHASQTHLKDIEAKWKQWASCLDEYHHVLAALSVGDIVANELYYHKGCYNDFYNAYCRYISQDNQSSKENDEQWMKSISFSKVVSYLYENESEFPGTVYYVKGLEEIYITLLKCHDIYIASHVTRFSDSLLAAIPELKKCTVGNKVTVFFEFTVNVITRLYKNTR